MDTRSFLFLWYTNLVVHFLLRSGFRMIRNAGEIKKQTYLIVGVFFAVLLIGALFSYADPAFAQATSTTAVTEKSSSGWTGAVLETVFRGLILVAFTVFGWFAGMAITIFDILINPAIFSLLNSAGIYQMWQFIRDFFNLFFILTLLYIAFTTIFQVSKDYKKALLNLVIMALLVNFSFPISRFLIDAGNVPMYYFANQISDRGATQGLGAIFGATELRGILLFGDKTQGTAGNTDNVKTPHLFAATIFMFIFAITLLVLAVMFVIRFAVLVILVIFSSVGFAGTVIPGMNKFASQWWESFSQYVLYGPAAMLMVLVSVRFFEVLATSEFTRIAAESATNLSANGMQEFMMASAKFSIPIVMLWIAIGLSSKMSIAGSAAVTGAGLGAIAWTRKKAVGGLTGAGKWAAYRNPVARGVGAGVKDRWDSSAVGKFLKSPSATEAWVKGATGTGTRQGELDKRRQKMVNDRVAEDKKNGVNNSTHRQNLKDSKDPVEREAAALALANDKALESAEEVSMAMEVLANNTDGLAKVIQNADASAIGKMDAQAYGKVNDSFYKKDANGNFARDAQGNKIFRDGMKNVAESFDRRVKKEGNIKAIIDHDIAGGMNRQDAYDKHLSTMSSEEIGKAKGIHGDAQNPPDVEVVNYVTNQVQNGNWTPKEHQDVYSKLNGQQKTAWRNAAIHP